MKKTTQRKMSERLAKYSAMSLAIAGVADANGQIAYTDVTPDYDGFNTLYQLDLDGDTVTDFFIFTGSYGSSPVNAVAIDAVETSNSFLGSAPGPYEYPFALNSGDPISSGQATWFEGAANGVAGTLNYTSCYNGIGSSNWCGVVDKYLGLRFKIGTDTHYGWVRLDVDAAGMNWTLKDYAYNTVPNEPINAGQTLSTNEFALNGVRVIALNNRIGLYNLPQSTDYTLYDISGKQVLKGSIESESHVIETKNIANGIYIVELTDNTSNRVIRKKVVL